MAVTVCFFLAFFREYFLFRGGAKDIPVGVAEPWRFTCLLRKPLPITEKSEKKVVVHRLTLKKS